MRALIVVGLLLFWLDRADYLGQQTVFLVVGSVFIGAYLYGKNYGLLIPGSLLLGLAWTAAALALFSVRINVVNVVALPMLLGIGIDIVVHLLHRLRSGSFVGETLRTTGVAVFFSTMTTIAAFVSLTTAHNRGLQSIGLVILIGLTALLVAAVLIITTCWPLVSKSARA